MRVYVEGATAAILKLKFKIPPDNTHGVAVPIFAATLAQLQEVSLTLKPDPVTMIKSPVFASTADVPFTKTMGGTLCG